MLLPQRLLVDLQCLPIERLGPGVVALVAVHRGKVVEAGGIVGVLHPQCLPVDFQCLSKERLGPGMVALIFVQESQIVEVAGVVGVFVAEHLLDDLHCFQSHRNGIGKLAACLECIGLLIQSRGLAEEIVLLGGQRLFGRRLLGWAEGAKQEQ